MIKKPTNGMKVALKKNNWRIIVDKFSGENLQFYDIKNSIIEPTCDWLVK